MKLVELLQNQKIIVQLLWGNQKIEFYSGVIGREGEVVYITPYIHNGKVLELNVTLDKSVVCNVFADEPVTNKRISWKGIELLTVDRNGSTVYCLRARGYNAMSNHDDRRMHERIPVYIEATLVDEQDEVVDDVVIEENANSSVDGVADTDKVSDGVVDGVADSEAVDEGAKAVDEGVTGEVTGETNAGTSNEASDVAAEGDSNGAEGANVNKNEATEACREISVTINNISDTGISIVAPKSYEPQSQQVRVSFTDKIGEVEYSIRLECIITRVSEGESYNTIGCKVLGDNKDYRIYELLKRLTEKGTRNK